MDCNEFNQIAKQKKMVLNPIKNKEKKTWKTGQKIRKQKVQLGKTKGKSKTRQNRTNKMNYKISKQTKGIHLCNV